MLSGDGTGLAKKYQLVQMIVKSMNQGLNYIAGHG